MEAGEALGFDVQCTHPVNLSSQGNMALPCGKCIACRIARAREWSVRLLHEMDYHEKAAFVTLTYNEENLPKDNSLSIRELQLFWKRLRKDSGRKLKYYASGEYGDRNNRPHYHAIIFGVSPNEKALVEGAWCKGFVYMGTVTYDSCRYVADYIMKKYDGKKQKEVYGERQVPFSKISKGIGKSFALGQAEHIKRRMGITQRGVEVGIPRYYKKLIDIDPEALVERAREKFDSRFQVFERRAGGVYGATLEAIKSREQNEKNIRAKANLRPKGHL